MIEVNCCSRVPKSLVIQAVKIERKNALIGSCLKDYYNEVEKLVKKRIRLINFRNSKTICKIWRESHSN